MKTIRVLALRREALTALDPADLRSVAGAGATLGTVCCLSDVIGTCVGCTPSPRP